MEKVYQSPIQSLWSVIQLAISPRKRPQVSPELQKAINECQTMEDLKAFLFALSDKDEATMLAFDRRIDELEQSA